jgi:hypothetical protein
VIWTEKMNDPPLYIPGINQFAASLDGDKPSSGSIVTLKFMISSGSGNVTFIVFGGASAVTSIPSAQLTDTGTFLKTDLGGSDSGRRF